MSTFDAHARWWVGAAAAVTVAAAVAVHYHRRRPQKERGHVCVLVPDVLTAAECAQLIADCRAAPAAFWSISNVWDAAPDPAVRHSRQGWLAAAAHPVAARLSAAAAALTGLPASHQEDVQIASYGPGGHFVAHHDACDPTRTTNCAAMNRGAGPRRATLLVYLNDTGLEGGETEFWPRGPEAPSVVVRPRTGLGVLFYNADGGDDAAAADPEGRVRPDSLHRANTVRAGEKWIATVWTHARPWTS